MKKLYLLRHAETIDPSMAMNDISRKLTPRGEDDAQSLGHFIMQNDHTPDLVLCSDAVRTRETWDNVNRFMPIPKPTVRYVKALYGGSRNEYLDAIQRVNDDINALMVIGHNPSIYELAVALAARTHKFAHGYAPCTLTILSCDIASWAALRRVSNTVLDVRTP